MTDYRRYYCNITVDSTFNAGNLPMQNLKDLDERLENTLAEWADEMSKKGMNTNINWKWSEHINV